MITNNKLVYVCVPSHDAEATVAAALGAILGQTYGDIKVLLVDNASTDRTIEIARGLAERDGRLEIFRSESNIGAESNFSRCIQLSGGDYTAIYHADDVYTPPMVAEEVEFLERYPEAGAVFTGAYEIDSAGKVIGRRRPPARLCDGRPHDFREVFAEVLKRGNFLVFPSALVRTSVYKDEIKAWNGAAYRTSADLDVWLRIAEKHPLGFIEKPLMKYRVSPASYSYNYARLRTERQDLFLVLEYYVKKYSGSLAGPRELADYRLLTLKDDISIAINHLIRGVPGEARARLKGIFTPGTLSASCRSFVQLKMLAYGYAAWMISFFPLGAGGRALVARVRHNG